MILTIQLHVVNLPSPWPKNARKEIRKSQRQLHSFDEQSLRFFQLDDIREADIRTLLIYLPGYYTGLKALSHVDNLVHITVSF